MSALDTGRLVRHRARALLSIRLHRARVSRLRLVGISAGVAQCPALAQKVPTLVELNLHRTQPLRISVQSIGIRTIRLAVHTRIRRDLERVEQLAAQALDGLPAEDIRQELHEIRRGGMLWRLQVDCLRYCRFVHSHHNAEDADFFSELRDTNPAINPVIDRLQAEHRRVSDDLEAVEAAANALADDDSQQARKEVVDTLQALGENLLAHLDYEELNLEATVLRVRETYAYSSNPR